MFRSVRWKIISIYFVIVLVTLLLLSGVLSNALEGYFVRNLEERLTSETVMTRQFITPHVVNKSANIEQLTRELGSMVTTRITIIDFNGEILGESDENISKMDNHRNRPEFIAALQGKRGVSTRHSETVKTDFTYVALPIYNQDQIIGAVRLAIPLTEIQKTLNEINSTIYGAFSLASIIFILLSLRFSAIVIKPMEQLTKSAKQIALGDLNHRAYSNNQDEIGELSQAINFMAQSLQDKILETSEQKGKLEAVLAHMTSGLIVVDQKKYITLVNHAAEILLQITKKKIVGKSSLALIRDFSLQSDLEKCLKQGKILVNELQLKQPEERYLQVFIAPIYHNKEIKEAVLVFTDITTIRELENMRSQFVANVSHELRTPLTAIKGFVETLQSGAANDPQTRDRFLSIIAAETERLTRLINDILELSKIEAAKKNLKLETFFLQPISQDVIQQLAQAANQEEINLIANIPDNIKVIADKDGVKQILLNLLTNSIKYTQAKGKVSLTAVEKPNHVLVTVKDTGIGIPQKDLPRIFERFYRVDKARTREKGGTGLGLSIVKHLVEGYGGKIWVESSESKGTTFYFTLPTGK